MQPLFDSSLANVNMECRLLSRFHILHTLAVHTIVLRRGNDRAVTDEQRTGNRSKAYFFSIGSFICSLQVQKEDLANTADAERLF